MLSAKFLFGNIFLGGKQQKMQKISISTFLRVSMPVRKSKLK